MAFDLFKWKNDGRDFARGEPPPADSIEWAGIPQSAANMMAKDRGKKPRLIVGNETKTEKPRPWLWGLLGFVGGLVTGSWGRDD